MTVARDDADENTASAEVRAAKPNPSDVAAAAAAGRHAAGPQVEGLRDGLPGLRDLVDRLLSERGCAWDRAQTLETLRPYLLEEAHEVLEAMHDPERHVGELGDLLFQIVFHAALREREGVFDLDDVIAGIRAKMIVRHPHVFGPNPESLSSEEIARRWELGKRARNERAPEDLGVPASLPSLHRAARLQEKAAAHGFDWPDVGGALAKLDEELGEFTEARASGDQQAIADELGDVLFVLVRIAGKLGLDAEAALARTNAKFERRFGHVLRRLGAQGLEPSSVGLEGLDALWNEAKRAERGNLPPT